MELIELIIAGLVTYAIAVGFKYLFKILWAIINWGADKYITEVLNAKVEGEPMVDYYPAKEVFKIRKAVKKNVR